MNCAYHSDREATTTCSKCGKPLCKECADFTNLNICMDCFHKSIRQAAHEEKLIGKPTLLLGAVGLVFGYMMNFGYATFLLVLVCVLMPSGYIYLGEMKRSSFMKIKGIGELLYYLVKVILSPFVGIYALPKYLFALIKNKDKK